MDLLDRPNKLPLIRGQGATMAALVIAIAIFSDQLNF